MTSFYFRLLTCVFCVVFLLIKSTIPAVALGGGIALEPIPLAGEPVRHTFKYIVLEGGEVEDKVVVFNNTGKTLTAILIPSGYIVENNQLVKVEPKTPLEALDPGYWVEFAEAEVEIPAVSQKIVSFKIKVPITADVGEHVGAILTTEKLPEAPGPKAGGVKIVINIGSRLTVTVPGDVHRKLLINNISYLVDKENHRRLNFVFNLTNDSNVALNPTIDIRMKGFFGRVGEMNNEEFTSILRGETADVQKTWLKRAPYFGRFVVDFDIHLGEYTQTNKDGTTTVLPNETITAQYIFWLFPWIELLYLLSFLLILYIVRAVWLYIVTVRRLRVKTTAYTVKRGDTLLKVSNKLGVNAKLLAKFNMVPWPYELIAGDKLLVPVGILTGSEWRQKERAILSNKQILKGIFRYIFLKKQNISAALDKIGLIAHEARPAGKLPPNTEIVVVEKGDTIKDVARFAGVSSPEIIKINNLRWPYKLRAGQELLIPILQKAVVKKLSKRRLPKRLK